MRPVSVILLFQSAAAAVAAGRLIWLNLVRRVPALFVFLVLLALSDVSFSLISVKSKLYFRIYLAAVPIYCISSIFAVRELIALVFRDYPGIRTGGRWAMYSGLILACGLSILAAVPNVRGGQPYDSTAALMFSEIAQRSVVFSLAILMATILFFLSRYPLDLHRNTYVSGAFFSAFFLSEALQLLIDSLQPRLNNFYIDSAQTVFATFCLWTWLGLLRPHSDVSSRARLTTAHEARLLEQLEALNRLLSRATGR